jgi:hypothetical protein
MNTTNTPDVKGCIADAMAELSRFVALLHKRFGNQLPYDIFVNLPAGNVQRHTLAKHALRVALVAALGEYQQWDTEAVTRFAAEQLEDVNLHYLASLLYEHTGSESPELE